MNSAPPSGASSTESDPPMARASSDAIARPRPVPPPPSEKNGENTSSRRDSGTPGPESATSMRTPPVTPAADRRTTPPAGVQRTAFSTRLETICRMRSPSPATAPTSA